MNGSRVSVPKGPRDVQGAESGSVAVSLLIVLAFIAVLVAAAVAYLDRWYTGAGSELQADRVHLRLDHVLSALSGALASDPTPASDSLDDPVWAWISSQRLAHVTLEDVSSRIDPNWIRPGVFDLTSLHELFSPSSLVSGSPGSFLRQYRFDHGFFTNLFTGYGMLFSPRTVRRYLTPWAYANVNLTDEFALQKLYEVRTGNPAAAELFHTRIQDLLKSRRVVQEKDLASFLGQYYDHLYPVVNAVPWWNVQFLPALILRQILAYPPYKIKHPGTKADELLEMRTSSEITPTELRHIVGLPKGKVIYQYLGTTTWFWKTTIRIGSDTLTAVLCRLPPKLAGGGLDAAGRPRYRVVWRHYSP